MTLRERYHVLAGELWGHIGGLAIYRVGQHSWAINDEANYRRAVKILQTGVEIGWDNEDPTHRLRPNQSAVRS